MRILFSSQAAYGHMYPLAPLAIATREQGHEVSFVTGQAFEATLKPYGVEHITGGMDMRQAFLGSHEDFGVAAEHEMTPERIALGFGSILPRSLVADLEPIIAGWRPDLVVHELCNAGAGLAAKIAGVPALCHGFGRMWEEKSDVVAVTQNHLREFAEELGVELAPGNDATVMLLGNPYIDICPPSIQIPEVLTTTNRIELRPVPFAEPGELPAWVVEHREPQVYLTLGTIFSDANVLRTAIEGLSALDVRVLVSAGPASEPGVFGDLPDNVVVMPWVPQADLLPHVDLVVHHGGSGTTLGACAVGVPQLLLPQGADQFTNADAVTKVGLGNQLCGEDVTAEEIAAKALHALSDDSVRGAAKAISTEVAAMPSPHDVARKLPDYA